MRAEFRQKIKDRGSWKYVTQAGCSFYYNETTGMCETEPPDYVRKRGMVRAVEAANFWGGTSRRSGKRRRTPTTGSSR